MLRRRNIDYLVKKKKLIDAFVKAPMIESYIVRAADVLLGLSEATAQEAWRNADNRCRAVAYLTMIHRLLWSETKAEEWMEKEDVDVVTASKEVEEESMAFCNFLLKNEEIVGDWLKNRALFEKWSGMEADEKQKYLYSCLFAIAP